MKSAGLLLSLVVALATSSVGAADCMKSNVDGAMAEGRLSLGQFEDAAGRPEQAFILTLPAPACLSGEEELDNQKNVETVHVFSFDDGLLAGLKKYVGKDVRVRGTPFPAHTAHHHAPIVMSITEIDGL